MWLNKKLIDREKSRSLSWLFYFHRSRARNTKEAADRELIGAKKGAIFGLIYFFKSFCIYYIPHNYVIPQAMPHAIPQTHSPFYPHRMFTEARCYDWWLILSLVLRDSTCLTDFIDDAIKLHDTNVESLSRMKDGIEALESWAEHNW